MKKNKILAIVVCMVLFSSWYGCTDKFKDYNTNPNQATEDMLVGLLRIGAFFPTMQQDVIPVSDVTANDYQRAQNLAGDMHSGYMTPIGTWNYSNNATQYNLKFSRWNDAAFDVAFRKVMPAWLDIKKQSESKYPEIYAVAQILKVEAMHRITDIYGPLPYLNFGVGENVDYDSQEDIYNSFFQDLNKSITVLESYTNKNPSAKPLAKYDLVYHGDFSKWLKFANSLKLRLALRIAYVNPSEAKTYAEEAVAKGVITQNSENAILKSGNGITIFNPLQICWDNYDDVRMGATMESYLTGYNDPRLPKYFQKSTYGTYNGARLGNTIYSKSLYQKLSSPAIYADTPIKWMNAAEIAFLRAEGALKGWNMGKNAKDLYEDGVKLSFEENGVPLNNYLQNTTLKPASFNPRAGWGTVPEGSELLSTVSIAWDNNATSEVNLERVITQKWLAIYPDGQEAWSEFRRTGYPRVFPVISNRNSNIDTQLQVRRLPFPHSEYDNNEDEVEKGVILLGGADNGGTKLWWDKKKRN